MGKIRLLIVCTGNTCRSAMAEGLMKRMLREGKVQGVEVRSAGTIAGGGSPASEGAIDACREVEVDLSDHCSTHLSPQLVTWADLVLCMENYHAVSVTDLVPGASGKTHLLGEFGPPDRSLEISDPVGLPISYYRACRDRLFDCLRGVLDQLPAIKNRSEMIALGSDEGGADLMREIRKHLEGKDLNLFECGLFGNEAGAGPDVAIDLGRKVAAGLAQTGLLVGTTGIGMSIAANKIPGVRAILAPDPQYAIESRALHDANVLCLGAKFQSIASAIEIVDVWLETKYSENGENPWAAIYERLEYGYSRP